MGVMTLKRSRENAGWTMLDIASEASISIGTVTRIESGQFVGLRSMLAYAEALGRSPRSVFDAWHREHKNGG